MKARFTDTRTRQGSLVSVVILWPLLSVSTAAQTDPAGQWTTDNDRAALHPGLDPSPYPAESLGLSLHLPAGAAVVAEKVNGQLTLSVSEQPDSPLWTMRIATALSTRPNYGTADHIADLLQGIRQSDESIVVHANDDFRADGVTGRLCFVERTNPSGRPYVTGWLILPSGSESFLTFTIQTLPEHLATIRPILEASFQTIRIRNTDELASERKRRLDAGQALLQSLTASQLRSQVGVQQWSRIYRPGEEDRSEELERGYALLEVLAAKKGALNPNRPENEYTADENKDGLLVRIQGRVVINQERGMYYDSAAMYWMAWDQSEESWSIRGTHRQGEVEQSEAETGIRTPASSGAPLPKLTVIKADNATNRREPFEWQVPEVYLSQPLGWVIARLLPKDVTEAREFGFYFYNFTNMVPQISLRVDRWEPASHGSGNFRLTTRLASDTQPTVSLYRRDGSLIRRTHPDGSITEPISLETLHRIWKSKGLRVSEKE